MEAGILEAPHSSLKRKQEDTSSSNDQKRARIAISDREIKTAVSRSSMMRGGSGSRLHLHLSRDRQRSRSPVSPRKHEPQSSIVADEVILSPSDEARRQAWRRERDYGLDRRDLGRRESSPNRRRDKDDGSFFRWRGDGGARYRGHSESYRPDRSDRSERPERIERPNRPERLDRPDRSERVGRPETTLSGTSFEDRIGGTYYNGTGKKHTTQEFRGYYHYSPSRVKEEHPASALKSAGAGLSNVPTMPKSMLPNNASPARRDRAHNKVNEGSDVYDDEYWQRKAMENVLVKKERTEDGRLRKDWEE